VSRYEHKLRRITKHMAAVAAFFLKLAGMAAFCMGCLGAAGSIEQGGDIRQGVCRFCIGLGVTVATACLSGWIDGRAE